MQYVHNMPFGAFFEPDGGVKFQVWAPGVEVARLKLLRPEGDLLLPMERDETGKFSVHTQEAAPGSLYFYDFGHGRDYPDPASRRQPKGIHGPSEVVSAIAYEWRETNWRGRPWRETAIYELHIGTFTPEGTYAAAEGKLDHLRELGVTALEIMPLAQGPGTRSWGYDGTYLYAPEMAFGSPDALKHFIEAAHDRDLMVFLDVVYNHFGPEGNYLEQYAGGFFTDRHKTPWGRAINFDQADSEAVREFYWHNALYWLDEYRFDGLRCDAVHAIEDDSPTHIFEEIAMRVGHIAARQDRHIHIIAENENNIAHLLRRDHTGRPVRFTAQWNDDFHHNLHVILTGERDAFFVDYSDDPHARLARCLTEGFTYQGEPSAFREGRTRGESTEGIPLVAFIDFLQNHDQAGNRPFGERLITLSDQTALRAAVAVQILNPATPLIFMGEEWGSERPFPYFCDFGPELSKIVRESRIKEFAIGSKFSDPATIERIPDPTARSTFDSAILDWDVLDETGHKEWISFYRNLLRVRATHLMPLLDSLATRGHIASSGPVLRLIWHTEDGVEFDLAANLSGNSQPPGEGDGPGGNVIFTTHEGSQGDLPPWSVTARLRPRV